jgi:hypothetical protein
MPLSESLQAQAFRELAEMTCAHCGKRKGITYLTPLERND